MVKQKTLISLMLFVVSVVFLISFMNAQTLIAGKIYNSDFTSTIANASILVKCNSNSLNTISLDDGTYLVSFNETNCNLGKQVIVNADKGNLAGSSSGTISKMSCGNNKSCGLNFSSIINIKMIQQKTTSVGSSGGGSFSGGAGTFYLCGNGVCDTGESINTCPKDCNKSNFENLSLQTNQSFLNQSNLNQSNGSDFKNTTTKNENKKTTNSGITGAVTGFISYSKTKIFTILFILIPLLFIFIALKFRNFSVKKG